MKLVSELQTNSLLVNKFFYLKYYKFLMLVVFLFPNYSFGQIANYVSNGSFEDCLNCNQSFAPLIAKYWSSLDTNKFFGAILTSLPPTGQVPNNSYTYQWPRTGNNYFISTLFFKPNTQQTLRGYSRNRLKQKLQVNKTYCVKVYYNITNQCTYGVDGFGAYFADSTSDTITRCEKPITFLAPQIQNPTNNILSDTLNWSLLTGTFTANGNEKYMILGNFKSDAATNSVIINPANLPIIASDILYDDISVIDIDLHAYAGPDIWGIPFNTVYLGRPQDVGIDEACMWYKLPNTTTAIDTAAGITVTVGVTIDTYVVRQEICGNVKWDTVIVYPSATGNVEWQMLNDKLNIYPNPANEIINIEFVTLSGVEACNTNYSIINSLGQIVREEVLRQAQQPNGTFTATINTKDLANGVYLLNLSSRGTRDLNPDPSLRNDNTSSVTKRFVIAR